MGTYSDSKITRARKPHVCLVCKSGIIPGTEYLRYALGLKWRVPVHIDCALNPPKDSEYSYNCAAIEARRGR